MRRMRLLPVTLLAVMILLTLVGCSGTFSGGEATSTPEPGIGLQETIVSALGEAVPEHWGNLSLPSGGVDLEILVTPGQKVLTNKILARVDDISQQAAVANAEAALVNAQTTLTRLEDQNASDNDIEVASKALEAAQANQRQAKKNLEFTVLKAPFDGTVVNVFFRNHENASPTQPIVLLADLRNLIIQTTDLGEVDVARVEIGDPAKIVFDALPDVIAYGKVIRIALKPEAGAGVYYTVDIRLDQVPEGLLWGMSAFLEIDTSD